MRAGPYHVLRARAAYPGRPRNRDVGLTAGGERTLRAQKAESLAHDRLARPGPHSGPLPLHTPVISFRRPKKAFLRSVLMPQLTGGH